MKSVFQKIFIALLVILYNRQNEKYKFSKRKVQKIPFS